jgi:hypothetical protein
VDNGVISPTLPGATRISSLGQMHFDSESAEAAEDEQATKNSRAENNRRKGIDGWPPSTMVQPPTKGSIVIRLIVPPVIIA